MPNKPGQGRPKGTTGPYKKKSELRVMLTCTVDPLTMQLIKRYSKEKKISLGRMVDIMANIYSIEST